MKTIEVDDELYHYIASRTQSIGESASDILRRLLRLPSSPQPFVLVQQNTIDELKELVKPKGKHKKEDPIEKAKHEVEMVLTSETFVNETKHVVRFLALLSALYKAHPEGFSSATTVVTGNERTYFAKEEAALLSHGNSVKAKQIPHSPFWVVTNNNTQRKGLIITHVMQVMGLPSSVIDQVKTFFS